MIADAHTREQFLRYVIVGLGSNILLFLAYLLITFLGIGHKTTMTLLYGTGVLQTFILNKSWSFKHRGSTPLALRRYITAYAIGYVINYVVLWGLVDIEGLPHQLVQGVMIFLIAGMLFLLQKFWIFTPASRIE